MIGLVTGGQFAFWMLAPVMILAAIAMVLVRKAVHSALLLATVMICLAVQYAAQDAPFLFAVQIIVYTGAILMLFLFVLMLVGVDASDSLVETIRGQRLLAGVAFLGFAVLLIAAVGNAMYGNPVGLANAQPDGNPKGIAQLLFGKYVFAFEVTSALLITAALGAMMLAHRERLTKKRTQRDHAEERIRKYAEQGIHPGPLPTPGVLARHNAVDTPALLPDGSIAPTSVSRVLQARGTVFPEADERADIDEVRKLNAGDVGDDVPSEPESTDLSGYGEGEKL
jgi:NADH-quinone oxidoreductase subunit J